MRIRLVALAYIVIALFLSNSVYSQAKINTTEIWLIDVVNEAGKIQFGKVEKITDNDHYDNQPFFSRDGKYIYFASMPDTIQTDIFEYNIGKKLTRQVTNTHESEYQPQPLLTDKNRLSVVRVDLDKAQRFYSIGLDGTDENPLTENEDSVAYYCWINDTTNGMLMLSGDHMVFEQFDLVPSQAVILSETSIGRCLQKIPGANAMSYIYKKDTVWTLFKYDVETEEKTQICETLKGIEDYCWTFDGKILAADKGKIFMWDTKNDTNPKWSQLADYSKIIGDFYRMAFSPLGNKLAVVSYKGQRP